MRTPVRLFVALLAVAAATGRSSAAPPSKEVEEVLSWVPADAAVFGHVDVQTAWNSKQMALVRKANPGGAFDQLEVIAGALGVPTDAVQSFTWFLPKVKGNGDQMRVCLALTLSKPYRPQQVVTALGAMAGLYRNNPLLREFNSDKFKKERENVYSVSEGKDGKEKTLFLFDNPMRAVVLGPKGHDLTKPTAEKTGPIADALEAARSGKAFALGLNFANLPDEFLQQTNRPEMEPFKPLFESQAIVASGVFADDFTLTVRAKCGSRAKALEAEKSLGVFRTLMQTALSVGIGEVQKDESQAKLVALGRQTQDILRTAVLSSDDTQATAVLKAKPDFDVTPFVVQLTGVTGGASARSVTVNNLKQIGLAMHNYHDTYGAMPASAIIGKKGKALLSWRVAILPYIEYDQLYKQFKLDEPWDSTHNKKVFEDNPMPKVFGVVGVTKPTDKDTHLQVFRGNGAMFDLVQGTKLAQVADGTSNTIMVAMAKTAVPWTKPDDIEFDPKGNPGDLLLFINDLTHTTFGDGSVRSIRKTAAAETWRAIVTKSGGEVANID